MLERYVLKNVCPKKLSSGSNGVNHLWVVLNLLTEISSVVT